jgi:hypothetical protein
MLHSGEIDTEQMHDCEIDVVSYLSTYGYPIDDILEAYAVVSVKTEAENTGHLVIKVQTLSKPIDEADAVDDQMVQWLCDCRDFQFNRSVDLEKKRLADWGRCKHIQEVNKSAKAEADNKQNTLP